MPESERFATCCILSYNRPTFVWDSIHSLHENARFPREVIVHDDGSDSETVNMLLDMHNEGMISTLILNSEGHNEGQGIALNRMFHMAKGDPICKLDHDLIYHEGWLADCVQLLDANKRHADADVQPRIGALGLFRYHHEPVKFEDMFVRDWTGGWEEHRDFVGSAMVIPRVAWEEFGPFEERSVAFAEDHAFKMAVGARATWCNALPKGRELATNVGFGPGPSTVVVEAEGGGYTSRKIMEGPKVIHL